MADLRIATASRDAAITILVNGQAHAAYRGETVHAALHAAGHHTLRKTTKTGQPRGIFCGMGVCYDCLVTIDGIPSQRACMTMVEDRMEIRLDE